MKISRIAVGVDFSFESQRAVDHAVMLARRAGAALSLVHVAPIPPPLGEGAPRLKAELRRERLEDDRKRLAELRQRLVSPGFEVSQVVVDGHAATALADTASALGAELLVVGTHGRTGLRRLALGSVAEKTVRLASASVLVARGDAPADGYRKIVVGTDYSPLSWRAVAVALELAAPGGHVHVVHAWQVPYIEFDLTGNVFASMRQAAEAELESHRARVLAMTDRDDVVICLELADGPAFAALDGVEPGPDLIVVSSHGRRGVERFLLGSVAEATVRHARCAVLVTR